MPRTREQFEEMREKSKSVIMEAALKLFSEKGYHATSIQSIAREAGVAAGLMYNYFASKEELMASIVDQALGSMIGSVTKNMSDTGMPPDPRWIIDATIAEMTKNHKTWQLIIGVLFQMDMPDICTRKVMSMNLHQQELYQMYFVKKGVPNPEKSARVLAAIVHGAMLTYAASGKADEIMLLRNTVIEKMLNEG